MSSLSLGLFFLPFKKIKTTKNKYFFVCGHIRGKKRERKKDLKIVNVCIVSGKEKEGRFKTTIILRRLGGE